MSDSWEKLKAYLIDRVGEVIVNYDPFKRNEAEMWVNDWETVIRQEIARARQEAIEDLEIEHQKEMERTVREAKQEQLEQIRRSFVELMNKGEADKDEWKGAMLSARMLAFLDSLNQGVGTEEGWLDVNKFNNLIGKPPTEGKKLTCEKHSRILIGKGKCVDCKRKGEKKDPNHCGCIKSCASIGSKLVCYCKHGRTEE